MKKVLFVLILFAMLFTVSACDNTEYETYNATITGKEYTNSSYWFYLEYEVIVDDEPYEYTASEKVSKTTYDSYDVGDTYVFNKPIFNR